MIVSKNRDRRWNTPAILFGVVWLGDFYGVMLACVWLNMTAMSENFGPAARVLLSPDRFIVAAANCIACYGASFAAATFVRSRALRIALNCLALAVISGVDSLGATIWRFWFFWAPLHYNRLEVPYAVLSIVLQIAIAWAPARAVYVLATRRSRTSAKPTEGLSQ